VKRDSREETEEASHIDPRGRTKENHGRPSRPTHTARPDGTGLVTRGLAIASLAAVVVVVAVIVLGSGASYSLNAEFQDASGLVSGDLVMMGPAEVGTVNSIGLTPAGAANVKLSLDPSIAPLHQGTVARIFEDSLSGIASKYVSLEPGPSSATPIQNGGVIGLSHTYSMVSLDAVFDTLDPLTRLGLRNVVRGEAASLRDKGLAANRALQYLAPGLQSASQVTAELSRDEPTFDQLIVDGGRAMAALASRSQQLSQLISNTSTATGAIARQSVALEQALSLLPGTLTRATTTFRGLDTTLNTLDPLVAASKPAVRQLPEFAARLDTLEKVAIPTVAQLVALIHNPTGTGDLTQLALQTPSLARAAAAAFPRLIAELNDSQSQLNYLRQYTPDVVAALTNLGQAGAYYDANGHYVRTQPVLYAFTINGLHQLTMQFPRCATRACIRRSIAARAARCSPPRTARLHGRCRAARRRRCRRDHEAHRLHLRSARDRRDRGGDRQGVVELE
jgi:phospholipid/cholesterol/gamma-HCH transport system substrate-binding protein